MTVKLTQREFDEVMNWRAQRLIELGEMPSREEFLAAVAKARKAYASKVRALRKAKESNNVPTDTPRQLEMRI
ncbi:MAG: hypothetical protein ACRDHZ_03890 [Ktedonobacteraceae bacterium]